MADVHRAFCATPGKSTGRPSHSSSVGSPVSPLFHVLCEAPQNISFAHTVPLSAAPTRASLLNPELCSPALRGPALPALQAEVTPSLLLAAPSSRGTCLFTLVTVSGWLGFLPCVRLLGGKTALWSLCCMRNDHSPAVHSEHAGGDL